MHELRRKTFQVKDRHDTSEITAIKFSYLDVHKGLVFNNYEDYAASYGGGIYIATDEFKTDDGAVVVGGKRYYVKDADEVAIYVGEERSPIHTNKKVIDGKVTINQMDPKILAELDKVRLLYLELKKAKGIK